MCGRYSLSKSKIELEERFQAELVADFNPRYNIAPTQLLPVITSDSPKGFSFFYWGITPDFGQNKPVAQKLINAKAETINEKISFKGSFQKKTLPGSRRWFFLNGRNLEKRLRFPIALHLGTRLCLLLPGFGKNMRPSQGNLIILFLILTSQRNEVVGEIHDRMPVIISRDQEKKMAG